MSQTSEKNVENIEFYFKSIKNSKGLSRKEEAEIGKRIQDGDKNAISELVEANLQFVVKTAKQFIGNGVSLEDLISEGNLALYRAAEKFDYTKGKKFITYAVWWIKSYMQEAVKSYRNKGLEVSIDDRFNFDTGDDESYCEGGESINAAYEEKVTDIQSRGMAVDELLSCLQERENKILSLYFGLHGEKQKNLKEISKEMGMSSERVRQIVKTSIVKLKANALGSDYFEDYKDLY